MWKVLASDGLHADAVDLLKKHDWVELKAAKSMETNELHEELKSTHWLIVRSATKVNSELIAAAPNLVGVIRAGVGVDNLDKDSLESAGVWMWNAPSGNFQAAAEHAIALMFAAARQIPAAAQASRNGQWSKKVYAPQGKQLSEATLALIGAGNIGARVGKMAKGIGMRVVVSDPVFEPSAEFPFEKLSFDEALEQGDFVSIHCPLLASTKHLMNERAFSKMKKTAVLVNAARGGIIDERALLNALEKSQLGMVALDVFEEEPFSGDFYETLLKHDRVIATPHLGASTQEAQRKVGMECAFIIEQAKARAEQQSLDNLPKPLNDPPQPRLKIF